jgi:hypothetical protein
MSEIEGVIEPPGPWPTGAWPECADRRPADCQLAALPAGRETALCHADTGVMSIVQSSTPRPAMPHTHPMFHVEHPENGRTGSQSPKTARIAL